MKRFFKGIAAILVLLTLFSTAYYFYDGIYNYKSSNIVEKTIIVGLGEGAADVATELQKNKIIEDPYPLLAYLLATGKYKEIKAGHYLLSSNMAGRDIAEALTEGVTTKINLTIIEGWDLKDIGQYFESQKIGTQKDFYSIAGKPAYDYRKAAASKNFSQEFAFLADKPANAGLEGYLFPDTYFLNSGAGTEEVVLKMLANFQTKLTPTMRQEIKKQNKTIYEIITMASIIEKEVKTLEDKKMVSDILWKRIKAGMPIQADATVLYALEIDSADKVYTESTKVDSPFNTYKYPGLPLGPICNPGLDSIIAAIHPTPNNYWYYLSDSNGKTIFSKNLTEHNIAKAKYLR
jgi:UPF0755 protein